MEISIHFLNQLSIQYRPIQIAFYSTTADALVLDDQYPIHHRRNSRRHHNFPVTLKRKEIKYQMKTHMETDRRRAQKYFVLLRQNGSA